MVENEDVVEDKPKRRGAFIETQAGNEAVGAGAELDPQLNSTWIARIYLARHCSIVPDGARTGSR